MVLVGGWGSALPRLSQRGAFVPGEERLPEIVWLVDEAERKLTELQPVYEGARISTDWREPIADPDVDLVDICLPDHLHHEAAKAALLAGKHVYCEKPFTSTVAEAAELAALAALSAGSSLG